MSLQADNAYNNVTSLTDTVNNLSGVTYTVNNLLKSVSLTASYISSDVLAINLSLTSVSGRCNALENTQNTTVLPNLQTLTTTSGYLNTCCINVSKICADLKTTVDNVSGRVALITSSLINISSTIDSVLLDNTLFKKLSQISTRLLKM